MKQATMMRKASALVLLLPVCQSNSDVPPSRGRRSDLDHLIMFNIMEEVEQVTSHHPRRLNFIVNECLDVTDYFSWNSTNDGENLLRLYYDCSCSGDFGSEFTMHCVLENHCFGGGEGGGGDDNDSISIAQNASLTFPEQCVSRSFTYDFFVDTETKEIIDIFRFVASDVFESGFGFEGNFTSVNYNPCRVELQLEHDYEMEEAIAICNNRTTCEAFFNENTTLTPDEIDYICPIVMFDGVECKAFNLLACAEFDEETQTRYVAMPDCSNVNPCLTSSCQAYPRINTAPERFLFRYPECDTPTENPTNDDTNTPTFAPTMATSGGDPTMPTSAPNVTDVCSNAIEYLGMSSDILKENYECECRSSGSNFDSLVLECRMEDYCFLDKNAASLEYCVNHNLTFTYLLDSVTNDIVEITRAEACTDFLQNGPEGRLCRNDWNICRLTLYNVLVDMENATAICLDRDACIEAAKSVLNYAQTEAEYLCPLVTLNGQECQTVGFDDCGEQDFENNLFFRNMPDCSNVESCAKSTCQTAQVRDPTPQRFMETYPQCGLPSSGGGNGGVDTPTNKPTGSPGNLSPGDTIRASGASRRGRFDSSFGSIFLCSMMAYLFSRW